MENIYILLILVLVLLYITNSKEYFKKQKPSKKNKQKLCDKVTGKKEI